MLAGDLALALDPALIMSAAGMKPDAWQAKFLRSTEPRDLLLCHRQAGKSTVTAALALWTAIYQAPALILLLAPALRQSQELFRKVLDFDAALGSPVKAVEKSALRVELANGSRVISLPGNSDETIRGYSGVSLLVVDEASRVDDALYYSIRPMLAVSGGRLACLSTPFGKRGFFFEAWEGGNDWQRHLVTAGDSRRVSAAFLAEEKAAMPESWFRQEYFCEFRDAVDAVFTHDVIQGAASVAVPPLFGPDSPFSLKAT